MYTIEILKSTTTLLKQTFKKHLLFSTESFISKNGWSNGDKNSFIHHGYRGCFTTWRYIESSDWWMRAVMFFFVKFLSLVHFFVIHETNSWDSLKLVSINALHHYNYTFQTIRHLSACKNLFFVVVNLVI